HGNTANSGANATPTLCTGLTERTQIVLTVGHLTNGCTTICQDFTHLTTAKTHCGVLAFTCNQLNRSTSRARQLCALTWLKLQAVDSATNGNIAQRQCITRFNRRSLAGLDAVSRSQPFRSNN